MTHVLTHSSGALILSDMEEWEHSLKMFEKSIQINDNLFETFVHKLSYLKFKILSAQGLDEEQCFRAALSHRFLDDCLNNIEEDSEDMDSHILQLMVDHKNDWLASDLAANSVFSDCRND